jgi:hypothetical protein
MTAVEYAIMKVFLYYGIVCALALSAPCVLDAVKRFLARRAERDRSNLRAATAMTLASPFGPIFDQPTIHDLIAQGLLDKEMEDETIDYELARIEYLALAMPEEK